jgi:hypothetical protein
MADQTNKLKIAPLNFRLPSDFFIFPSFLELIAPGCRFENLFLFDRERRQRTLKTVLYIFRAFSRFSRSINRKNQNRQPRFITDWKTSFRAKRSVTNKHLTAPAVISRKVSRSATLCRGFPFVEIHLGFTLLF